MPIARTAAITATAIVFAWPALAARMVAPPPSFLWLTGAFVVGLALAVRAWPEPAGEPADPGTASWGRAVVVAAVALAAAATLGNALQQWVAAIIARPYNADMLVVVREGTRRFLGGLNPYTHYQTYDAPWDMVLPYGPLLWGPYLAAQASATDLRVVTIVGELTVPLWAAVAAVIEARRGRLASSLAWLGLLGALVAGVHLTAFSLMGHTPAYWPLFPLFAWLVTTRRWPAAALAMGGLIVARSTMVALVPILIFAIWRYDRAHIRRAVVLVAVLPVLLFGPFVLWDVGSLWETMVTSYPRIVKSVVWVPPAQGVVDTIGITGWLVLHHLERWAEATQVLAMLGVYLAAWRAIGRGAAPLAWMAVALTAFSMTALWPLFYLYFDVLLLLTSGAVAETLAQRFTVGRWTLGLAVTALAVLSTSFALTDPYPSFAFSPPLAQTAFAVPRRVTDAATIQVDYELPHGSSQHTIVAGTLNGQALWTFAVTPGLNTLRFPAPVAVWWRGFNRLDLTPTPAPSSTATIHRIAVVPRPRH